MQIIKRLADRIYLIMFHNRMARVILSQYYTSITLKQDACKHIFENFVFQNYIIHFDDKMNVQFSFSSYLNPQYGCV